jgi:hypothetical protein
VVTPEEFEMFHQQLYEAVRQERERELVRRHRAAYVRRAVIARRRQRQAEQARRRLAAMALR